MSGDMERIATNAGKPTRRIHKGREFLVTSATLIVPGVLNGSQGALYYPPEEISRDPQRWNGVPVTVGHPTRNGTHVSGRDPDVLEEVGIGHVYRATANGKLTAEAWFDVDATRNYDRKNGTAILTRLESGETVELSTGLFTDNEPTPGTYNGRAYTHVARNYRPDHLALLHDQRGACSVTDGCGFGVNTDTTHPAVDSLLSELDGLIGVNVAGQVRSKVTGWFKRLGAGTGKGEAHEAAQSGAMTLDDDDRRLGADAAAQFASAGHNPASWVADEAIWERAKAAAAKFEGADDYYAVVAHIYRRMGGEVKEMTENEFESDEQRRAFFGLMGDEDRDATPPKGAKDGDKVWKGKVISAREANDLKKQGYIKHFDEVGVVKGGKVIFNQAADTEEITMPFDKKQAVNFLTANCDCWKGREATLNKLSDEELQGIQNHVAREIAERQKTAAVVNTFTKGIKLGAATLTVNAEGQAVVRNADGEECAPDDVKCLEMMKAKEKAPPPVPAANQAKPQTEAEWFATAPPTIQAAVRNAMAVERAEREQLADRLTANAAADQKDTLKKFLLSKTLDELRQLAPLVAPAANQHNPFVQVAPHYTVPHYLGAATPVALNAHAGQELETLDLPVMNWDTAKN